MARIRLIVFDVDGTLTDGSVNVDEDGGQTRRFNIQDGLGVRMAAMAGVQVAIISGRASNAVESRMRSLGITEIHQGVDKKARAVRQLLASLHLDRQSAAFVGDDLNDLAAFNEVGLHIAVADAAPALAHAADYVTPRNGGEGAGRDAIEFVLRRNGDYDRVVAEFAHEEPE
jgi:3-deoxy-D-manno-octulosonate 8-phosphate phosphatase (KDO 8-P phosphatase)